MRHLGHSCLLTIFSGDLIGLRTSQNLLWRKSLSAKNLRPQNQQFLYYSCSSPLSIQSNPYIMQFRIQKDSIGQVQVPVLALWGAATQRSLQFFNINREKDLMDLRLIKALALIKKAAAQVNMKHGVTELKSKAIQQAAQQVLDGKLTNNFPLSTWQTGSGTQTNMNVNEVLANRAAQLLGQPIGQRYVDPNDEVNKSQSSNDCFPSAMHIAIASAIHKSFLPVLDKLLKTLKAKALQFQHIVKVGRTHLQDATPLTLGQQFSAYFRQIQKAKRNTMFALQDVYELAQGGTAVGTGVNAPQGFGQQIALLLSQMTGIPFRSAKNKFQALSCQDSLANLHGCFQTLAVSLNKIGNDIRLMGTGPRCGLGQLKLPQNQPGSSIMPGKVNPTQVQALTMICCQVLGNGTAVKLGCSNGHFQLNVYRPMIAKNILHSCDLLCDGIDSFIENCLTDLKCDKQRNKQMMQNSLMNVTVLTPHIGYQKSATIAKRAQREGLSLKQAGLAQGLKQADYEQWMDVGLLLGNSKLQF